MLTAGIPNTYTGKIFLPDIQIHNGAFVKLNLAAVRRNGISTHVILSSGDSFAELKIKGVGGDYFIPIDLWDLYQLLTQCEKHSGTIYSSVPGADVIERLQKVGVSLARYEAWRLTKRIPYWPKSELIQACLTHRSQLLERANELLNESFYDLNFVDLILNIPGGLEKSTLRFSDNLTVVGEGAQRSTPQEAQISIKIDYELEPVSAKPEEMVLA